MSIDTVERMLYYHGASLAAAGKFFRGGQKPEGRIFL